MDFFNRFFTVFLIVFSPAIIWTIIYDVKNIRRRVKIAQKILDICKVTHRLSDLNDSLSNVTSLTYSELFDVVSKDNIQKDTEISIFLYHNDEMIKYKISEKLEFPSLYSHTKIGKIEFFD